ncbi:MAG: superoxide dismutase [Bacteroidales bacterium]|nr:superoxide dismutase [Bacteroidales bacterium]MBP6454415.1 superoxide dismutase [Bacteroidales bacterium]MBP8677021.1 superoxide dismutase [Bacteroidales bacterium]MBP9584884.1 superoxide dismutase [Bacteroidales bacterium]MBP9977666.1 superoxide dismutase [Bacteroidales bacterium]
MTTINKLEFHNLPYAYDALEPFIDKMTMEIHHSKHHKAYYDNMMNAVKGTDMEGKTLEEVFANMSKYPAAVRNNGGGYYNHNLYWEVMKVNGGKPSAKLEAAIVKTFGSMDELKKQFTDAGKTRFGSGWAWLSVDKDGKLFVSSTPNQDNPLMDVAEKHGTPILGMDVWEHAYYLKYQNKRPDYTEAFWNVINWEAVSKKYDSIVK